MNLNLLNKNVIISGATGGIGKTLVKAMSHEGANILMTGTSEEKLKNFSKELSDKVKYVVCDLSNSKNIEAISTAVEKIFENRVDVLINNAGITSDNLALRMKEDEWYKVINLNLNSTFFLTKEIIKLRPEKVLPKSGSCNLENFLCSEKIFYFKYF